MNILTDVPWLTILLVAVSVIGGMQWLKGMVKTIPSKLQSIIALVLCLALFALATYVAIWIVYATTALAFFQLGYEIIIQGIPELIKRLLGNAEQPKPPAVGL